MYKVFNSNALIILNSDDVQLSFIEHHIKVENKDALVELLNNYFSTEMESDIFLFGYDIEELFTDFCSVFQYIEAAGGIVKNRKGEILFIKRLGYWDFPKGKIEKGENPVEAAIREVVEETAVEGLQIVDELKPTYHIYGHSKVKILKKTFWYEMKTDFEGKLNPQMIEDIELAEWHKIRDVDFLLQNSYRSLRDGFKAYFKY